MPNWCSNKIIVEAKTETINEVNNRIFRSIDFKGNLELSIVKVFILGCAGILQPTKITKTPNCDWLTNKGLGSQTPENKAYDIFLELFNDNALLDANMAIKMQALTKDIGLNDIKFVGLDQSCKDNTLKFLKEHAADLYLCSFMGNSEDQSFIDIFDKPIDWEMAETINHLNEDTAEVNLNKISGLPLQVYLNGFNGRGLPAGKVQSGYDYSCSRWGTKWSAFECSGITTNSLGNGRSELSFYFSTAWSPSLPFSQVIAELYQDAEVKHLYCEIGCDFTGVTLYSNGLEVNSTTSSFEYSDEDDDGDCEVIGPDYLIEHFGDYSWGG